MGRIGAAVWATGHAGRVIVEAGLTRPWLEFRGGIVYDAAKDGLDLGEACGLDVRLGAPVSTDVDAVLARPDIDVVFYAGIGSPAEVAAACLRANRAGKDAITISGLVHPATILGAAAAAELDAAARAAGQPDPRHRVLGLPDDHAAARRRCPTCPTYDEIRLERVADTSLWGHGILRDEGDRRADRGGRRRLHDAQLPGRGADAARRIGGLEIDEPIVREHSRPDRCSPRAERLRRRAWDDRRPRPAGAAANIRGGGRLVSLWRGLGSTSSRSATAWKASARVIVDGDPPFETIVRGDLFLDTYPPTGARAMAAVRPLRLLPPGAAHDRRASAATDLRVGRASARLLAFDHD